MKAVYIMKAFKFYLLLFLLLRIVPEAIASPSVTIAPASDSVYVVQGNDFSGVSGVDATIRYDATALASPNVVQGGLVSGAIMAVNASTPGMVRLALVRVTAMNGSGPIAMVTFTRLKSTGTDIQSLNTIALVGGRNTTIPSQIVNSAKTEDTPATASAEQQTGQPAAGPSPPPAPAEPGKTSAASTGVIGLVAVAPSTPSTVASAETTGSIPSTGQAVQDVLPPSNDKAAPAETVKEPSREAVVAKAVEPERKTVMMYQSVLERFKEFKGEKTPAALIALFATQGKGVQQDPPIVLSDGKSTVKVVLELNSKGENNNFLLDGVSLVSLKNKEKDEWIVELLPDAGTCDATISVPLNSQWYVIPLTVAAPMNAVAGLPAGKLTEEDFNLYLKQKSTANAPRFDLNKDGRHDYKDDYIFTANYLVQRDNHAKERMQIQK